MNLEAARLVTYQAGKLCLCLSLPRLHQSDHRADDEGFSSGEYANAAKWLAGEAAFKSVETAMLSMGGVGFAKEYHIERYFREVRARAYVAQLMC